MFQIKLKRFFKKNKSDLLKYLAVVFSALFLPLLAFADISPICWFTQIINNILNFIVWPVFYGASIIMLIFAGFMYVTAAGEPGKIKLAKDAVIWAIVGIIVATLAFSATAIINTIIPTVAGGGAATTCTAAPAAAPAANPAACQATGSYCAENGGNNPITGQNCCTGQCVNNRCYCVPSQGPCSANTDCCSNICVSADSPTNNTPGIAHCY